MYLSSTLPEYFIFSCGAPILVPPSPPPILGREREGEREGEREREGGREGGRERHSQGKIRL